MNSKFMWAGLLASLFSAGLAATMPEPAVQLAKPGVGQAVAKKLSINQANVDQLQAIPGIGRKKAEAILAHIKQHGAIRDVQQLQQVKGIGPKIAARIAEFVNFG